MADDFVPRLVARLQACRDRLVAGAAGAAGRDGGERRRAACTPSSASQGSDDSLALAKRLVAEHGLGLAPGAAFGDEGEGWLRWCFASQDPQRLDARAGPAGARRSRL